MDYFQDIFLDSNMITPENYENIRVVRLHSRIKLRTGHEQRVQKK